MTVTHQSGPLLNSVTGNLFDGDLDGQTGRSKWKSGYYCTVISSIKVDLVTDYEAGDKLTVL